jgi:hypothetical protein
VREGKRARRGKKWGQFNFTLYLWHAGQLVVGWSNTQKESCRKDGGYGQQQRLCGGHSSTSMRSAHVLFLYDWGNYVQTISLGLRKEKIRRISQSCPQQDLQGKDDVG